MYINVHLQLCIRKSEKKSMIPIGLKGLFLAVIEALRIIFSPDPPPPPPPPTRPSTKIPYKRVKFFSRLRRAKSLRIILKHNSILQAF